MMCSAGEKVQEDIMKMNYFVGILLAMQGIVGVSGNGRPVTCCNGIGKYTINTEKIDSYIYEKPPCYKKAVRFMLKNGIVICSDPEDNWAKHAIKILDKRLRTKAQNMPPSSTSTTTQISSPGTPTVTMTIPKGTLITWKPTTFIHSISTKQSLRNTYKQPQRTSIQTIKMTTSMDNTPSITDFKTTSMTMLTTTKSPLTTTIGTTIGTSTTWKPTSYITHKASEKELPRNSRKPPHWVTTRQFTTTKERKTFTPETMTTSMTRTTKNRVTLTTPKGTSNTWKPTAYITHRALIKELPKNTKNLPNWMTTRQTVTTKERKTVTPETMTTSMSRTTENRGIMTTPRGTSTTQRRVQKTSPINVTTRTTRCPPFGGKNLDRKEKNIPWTMRRLKKKRKQGLRRVQMNTGCIEH